MFSFISQEQLADNADKHFLSHLIILQLKKPKKTMGYRFTFIPLYA